MKSFLTAAALSLLAVTAAQASGVPASNGVELRSVELTDSKDIREAGSSSVTVTVGAPTDLPVAVPPPRDRVEAGFKAEGSVTGSVFPEAPGATSSAR